ncbi:hypothetical protein B6V73_13590 [Thioclava sp. JM3]|uniref:hypothetical protein n=1 Tax=Thioclava sp. JM3 TaxID=1973004 RepID=UPI000B5467A4|nr:hypothetical protein [Thioclava sp. JM3]OWY16210.1 hypothetical protein B6V73_13590 [Thioclava sp. JM3]
MTYDKHPTELTAAELREERSVLANVVLGATAKPSPKDLENAPLLEDWMLFTGFEDISLFGRLTEATGRTRTLITRAIIALDDALEWAYLEDGYMRLGPRFSVEEAPPHLAMRAVATDLRGIRTQLEGQAYWAQKALDALGEIRCDA